MYDNFALSQKLHLMDYNLNFFIYSFCSYSHISLCDSCSGHTKILVSLLHDLQLNDQRATLLQLVDKFKVKWKGLGISPPENLSGVCCAY